MDLLRPVFAFSFCLLWFLAACRTGLAQGNGSPAGQAQEAGHAARPPGPSFHIVPLGVKGGSDESDLSSYMVAPEGSNDYICLDAGTLRYGICRAIDSGAFRNGAGQGSAAPALVTPEQVLRQYIKAYLISHPHLDHVAGLVLNAPDDSTKNIYGLPFCLDVLRDNYFTWKSWANFADQGEKPFLNKYHYVALSPGAETPVERTAFSVRAFPLSHSAPNQSTAFLVRDGDACLLYLGDTGADSIEGSDDLHRLWQEIGLLVRNGRLKALFIEVSFPDEQPDKLLFGHLTPRLLMQEMRELARSSGEEALSKLPILITHSKPAGNREGLIKKELAARNSLRLRLFYPEQAKPLEF
jgi:cAMP phosphodiesterase